MHSLFIQYAICNNGQVKTIACSVPQSGATILVEIFQLVRLAATAAHTAQLPTRSCARQQAVRVDTNIPPRNRHVSVSMPFMVVNVIWAMYTVNQLLSLLSVRSHHITVCL